MAEEKIISNGARKLEGEKEKFLKAFEKESEEIRKIVEDQYDLLFGKLCEKADADPAFNEQVMQDHKSWARCYKYVEDNAKKMAASGRMAMVQDNIVFGWVYEYYALDDKAEVEAEEKKKAEAAAKRKAADEARKKKEQAKAAKAAAKAAQLTLDLPVRNEGVNAVKQEQKPEQDLEDGPADAETRTETKPEPKPARAKSKDADTEGQLSLFDMFS